MTAKQAQAAWDALRRENAELAAQNEILRSALSEAAEWNWFDIDNIPCQVVEQIDRAKSLPNTAADILRQRDARTLRDAAHIFDNESGLAGCDNMTTVAGDRLRKMAKELEAQHG